MAVNKDRIHIKVYDIPGRLKVEDIMRDENTKLTSTRQAEQLSLSRLLNKCLEKATNRKWLKEFMK